MHQEPPAIYFHVTPSANRESIRRYGLDWTRMGANERGIANGWPGKPEAEGIFLTEADTQAARFFVRFGGGREIDVWRVDVSGLPVEPGWWLCRVRIPASSLELVEVWATSGDEVFGEPSPLPPPPTRRQRR